MGRYLSEDGTAFYVLESGTGFYLKSSGGPPPVNAISSAGVFDSTGALVRTIWSASINDPRSLNPVAAWDGTLDDGSVAPSGNYTVNLLTNNVTYTWEGVVGNSSPDHSNVSVSNFHLNGYVFTGYHAYGGNINDMAINAAGEMYFVTGYDERMNTMHVATTSNPQYANGILIQGFRQTYTDSLNCCTDGNIVYLHYWDSGPTNVVWGINCTTKLAVTFSSGTGSIGGGNTIAASTSSQFIIGIAVQQSGNLLFVSRAENLSALPSPTYSVWVLNKTTGALLQDNLLGYKNQGKIAVSPTDGSAWIANSSSSPTTNATWDPVFLSPNVVLSSGNLTASNPNAVSGGASADHIYSTGSGTKIYFEVVVNANGGIAFSTGIGATDALTLTGYLGFDAHSASYYGDGTVIVNSVTVSSAFPLYGPGDNIGVAVDIANHLIWWRKNGGNWNLGGAANPATGTGGQSTASMASPVFAGVGFDNVIGSQVTANFSSASWTYTAPAGFIQLPGANYSTKVSQFTTNSGTGVMTATGVNTAALQGAVGLAISPDGSTLLVADGGTSQQIKAFNTSDGSVKSAWGISGTLGLAGGYANGPAVTNTKFMFLSFMGFSGSSGWIAYAPDGSFWFGDAGNARYLHFSSGNSPTYIEQIAYLPAFYGTWVCFNDPTRVFATYLEFKIDYSKSLAPGNGSWALVNNWFFSTPAGFQQYTAQRYTITGSNGRTYVPVNNVVYEMTSTGMRNTGVTVSYDYIDRNFNLWGLPTTFPGSAVVFKKNAFAGFDGSNNPTWATNPALPPSTIFLTSQTLPAGFPEIENPQAANNTSNVVEPLANGVIPVFDDNGNSGNHFGGIDSVTGLVKFSAHPPLPSNYGGLNTYLEYPSAPYFSQPTTGGTGVINPGGFQAYVPGMSDVFTLYRGEDWGSNQTSVWSHWHQSGLVVNRTGVAGPYFGQFFSTLQPPTLNAGNLTFWDSQPGALNAVAAPSGLYGYMGTLGFSGNSGWGGISYVNGNYYLYSSDEWYHGGMHRWRISNLNSISTSSTLVSWNSSSYTPPSNPYNFLLGLPYNTLNLAASVGGWTRTGGPDNTTGTINIAPWYRAYTNAIIPDLHAAPDLVFEARLNGSAGTASASYSWTRVGSGNWTLSATMAQAALGSVFGGSVVFAIYIDILDNTGKKIVRMFNAAQGGGPTTESLFVNGLNPIGPTLSPSNNIWMAWVVQQQPLSVHYDSVAGTMTVNYAGFTMVGVTVNDAGANIANPAQFKLTYFSAPANEGFVSVCFTKLQFADA